MKNEKALTAIINQIFPHRTIREMRRAYENWNVINLPHRTLFICVRLLLFILFKMAHNFSIRL